VVHVPFLHIGESTEHWAVRTSNRLSSAPSSTPKCKQLPISRNSDTSASRIRLTSDDGIAKATLEIEDYRSGRIHKSPEALRD
jgi:hypothetical protein